MGVSFYRYLAPWAVIFPLFCEASTIETRWQNSSNAQAHLSAVLSSGAAIYTPSDVNFTQEASRWSDLDTPGVSLLVDTATVDDIITTARYAMKNDMHFLVQSAGHGWTNFSTLQDSLIIKINRVDSVSVNLNESTATVAAGAHIQQVVDAVAPHGKMIAAGSCNCVGFIGATLGGGHGRLQGLHGLMIDSLLSAKVLLPNGEIVVASNSSEQDLFYALRGAGHNFGVILEATYRILDAPNNSKFYDSSAAYSGDKLEEVIEAVRNFTVPPEVTILTIFTTDATTLEPFILFDFSYIGDEASGKSIFEAQFGHIEAMQRNESMIPYDEFNLKGADGAVQELCDRGGRKNSFTTGMQTETLNVTDVRTLWNEFTALVASNPAQYIRSLVVLESYGMEGVRAQDWNATAYPNREVDIILLMIIWYDDAELDDYATNLGGQWREMMRTHDGLSAPRVYENYGHGDESEESMYGYSDWRLQKITDLKRKYDPKGLFDYFHSIPAVMPTLAAYA